MVDIKDLWLTYPGALHPSVHGISLAIRPGEFLTLLGPSGCGKTSTLRSVAGLETPTSGSIAIGSRRVFDSAARTHVATHARDIAMVFQSYAIWPHMTVGQNVAFPLDVMKLPAEESRRRVAEALDMVGLGALGARSATQLSGGQQQRVAIARALVRRAAVMLLDEPLSNLDAKLREQMRVELRDLLKRVGMTAIYVTHDQEEALDLADEVVILKDGRVVQLGSPEAVTRRPNSAFVMDFLGDSNRIPVTVEAGLARLGEARFAAEGVADGSAELFARPRDLAWRAEAAAAALPARILRVLDRPDSRRLIARTASGQVIELDAAPEDPVRPGHVGGIDVLRWRVFAKA